MATVHQLSHLIAWNWKKWMEKCLRNIKFHSFQRAFIVEFENDEPTLHFEKNLIRQEWRILQIEGEKGPPEQPQWGKGKGKWEVGGRVGK
jgi:hypothetical protein